MTDSVVKTDVSDLSNGKYLYDMALSLIMASHVFTNTAKKASGDKASLETPEYLIQAFKDAKMCPETMNDLLDTIANNESMPDHIVDAALALQDQLVEATPALKVRRDGLRDEYSDLLKPYSYLLNPQP